MALLACPPVYNHASGATKRSASRAQSSIGTRTACATGWSGVRQWPLLAGGSERWLVLRRGGRAGVRTSRQLRHGMGLLIFALHLDSYA